MGGINGDGINGDDINGGGINRDGINGDDRKFKTSHIFESWTSHIPTSLNVHVRVRENNVETGSH